MRRPLKTFISITSKHGQSTGMGYYGKHLGTDYSTPIGTPVYAPCSATVIATPWSDSVGRQVYLKEDTNGRIHRLMHLSSESVTVGQHVTEGYLIAESGNSGSNTTGAHLHWDVRKAGTLWDSNFSNYYDPEALVAATPTALTKFTRTVGLNGVNYRKSPSTTSSIITNFKAGEVLTLKGYVTGQSISGNPNWFVGYYNGGYLWSGAFTNKSVSGIKKLN